MFSFSDYVNFRHEPVSACKIFDVNRTKYRHLENKSKIDSYYVTYSNQNLKISGPATIIESETLVYTCTKGQCIFPCLCKHCVLGENECSEHNILHPGLFDYTTDYFTVRNSDSYISMLMKAKSHLVILWRRVMRWYMMFTSMQVLEGSAFHALMMYSITKLSILCIMWTF